MPDTRIIELVQAKLTRSSWGILGNQGHVLGVDLGGYGLRAALIDLHKHTYTSTHMNGMGTEPQLILEEALQMCRDLLAQSHVKADRLVRIGVGFGGPVDPVRGTIRLSPRMSGWEDFMLKDRFEQAFDTVTLIDNDANLIALGEATFGVAQDYNNLFYLHLSSGVGGGIVIDGRLYQGATATAAEIGHAVARKGGENDQEAATLEELVSIKGILQRARYAGLFTDNLHDIFSEHPIGQQIVQETIDLIALHLAQVVALLDPEIIVLGGIVVRIGGSAFIERIAHQMNQYTNPQFVRPVTIVSSALGNHSITIGALALALESLQE
jgi:glucokinase